MFYLGKEKVELISIFLFNNNDHHGLGQIRLVHNQSSIIVKEKY